MHEQGFEPTWLHLFFDQTLHNCHGSATTSASWLTAYDCYLRDSLPLCEKPNIHMPPSFMTKEDCDNNLFSSAIITKKIQDIVMARLQSANINDPMFIDIIVQNLEYFKTQQHIDILFKLPAHHQQTIIELLIDNLTSNQIGCDFITSLLAEQIAPYLLKYISSSASHAIAMHKDMECHDLLPNLFNFLKNHADDTALSSAHQKLMQDIKIQVLQTFASQLYRKSYVPAANDLDLFLPYLAIDPISAMPIITYVISHYLKDYITEQNPTLLASTIEHISNLWDYGFSKSIVYDIAQVYSIGNNSENLLLNKLLTDFIAEYKDLNRQKLSLLVAPILSASHSAPIEIMQHLMFISKRLAQYGIEIPQELVANFTPLLTHSNVQAQRLAADFFAVIHNEHVGNNITINLGHKSYMLQDNHALQNSIVDLLQDKWPNITSQLASAPEALAIFEQIAYYQLTLTSFDRYGISVQEVLAQDAATWQQGIDRIIYDNHFFVQHTNAQLLEKIRSLNANNQNIMHLLDSDYLSTAMQDINDLSSQFINWQAEDFKQWAANIQTVNHDNITEVMAVLREAVHVVYGFYPRDLQLLTVLSLYAQETGSVAQVATGEGKSIIIAMFAAIQVLSGKKVDVITSAAVLAERDYEDTAAFFTLLGIASAHNTRDSHDYKEGMIKECYHAPVVYGTILHFAGDLLRDLSANTRDGRPFEIAIIDEEDSLMIDSSNRKVQLSSGMPGFESIKPVLTQMWGQLRTILPMLQANANSCIINNLQGDAPPTTVPESCDSFLWNVLYEHTIKNILVYEQKDKERIIHTPVHLQHFLPGHVNNWLDSIFSAITYKDLVQYLVTQHGGVKSETIIAPLDYENTGALQPSLKWNNGLHQFLELKHALTLHKEGLISTFISYPNFLLQYKSGTYGLSGTVGGEPHRVFLQEVYSTDSFIMPTYIHKDLNIWPTIVAEDVHQAINGVIARQIAGKRAALIIFNTISEVEDYYATLQSLGYQQIFKYTTGISDAEKSIIKKHLAPGDVIIATNIAGRGTDLQLQNTVVKNGGLHVILANIPVNQRVEWQAFGRAARQDQSGSAQLIFAANDERYVACNQEIPCLKEQRDIKEEQKLLDDIRYTVPAIQLQDELFKQFMEVMHLVNSPTGYAIDLGKPSNMKPSTIYVYIQNEHIHLQLVNPDKQIVDNIDVEEYLHYIDPQVEKHIKIILSTTEQDKFSINAGDYELIHFIATLHQHTKYQSIYKRVVAKYNKEKNLHTDELTYLKHSFPEAVITAENLPHYIKKQQFSLWKADRALFNNKHEIKQAKELWAIWLKEHDLDRYSITNVGLSEEEINARNANIKQSLPIFMDGIWHKVNTQTLMSNPTYLIEKAWSYVAIHYQQAQDAIDQARSSSPFSFLSNGLNAVVQFFTRSLFGNYEVEKPLDEAMSFINQAIEKDTIVNTWVGYNAKSYLHIIQNQHLFSIKDATAANNTKREFASSALAAIEHIRQYVIPALDGQLATVLTTGIGDIASDISLQLLYGVQLYENIIEVMRKNIEILNNSGGDTGTRLGANISLEGMASKINITEVLVQKFNVTNPVKENSKEISDLLSSINFTGKNTVVQEISDLGVVLFELETYKLYQKKSWRGSIFSAILGVVQIAVGLALTGGANLFVQGFAKGLLIAGSADVIRSVASFAENTPIDIKQYMHGKGIGLAISVITAGLVEMGQRVLQFNNAANAIGPAANMELASNIELVKNAATTALGLEVFGRALTSAFKEVAYDEEEIKAKAQETVAWLFKEYSQEMQMILAYDSVDYAGRHTLETELREKVGQIVMNYNKKYNDDRTRISLGVVTNIVSHYFGGSHMASQVVDKGSILLTGGLKSANGFAEFRAKIASVMKEISQKATMHKAFNHYVISKGVSAKDKSAMLQMKFVAEVGSCQKLESVVSVELFNACQRVEKKFQSKYETSVLQQDIAMMLSGSASSVLLRDVISPMAGSFGKDLHEQAVRIINDVTKNHASLEELKAAQKQELAEKQKIFEAAGNSMGQEQVEGLAEGRLYKVKKGDSLVKISEKSGVQLTEILKQNPGITDANKIKAGQVLYLGEKGVEALKHNSQTSAMPEKTGSKTSGAFSSTSNAKLIEVDVNGKMKLKEIKGGKLIEDRKTGQLGASEGNAGINKFLSLQSVEFTFDPIQYILQDADVSRNSNVDVNNSNFINAAIAAILTTLYEGTDKGLEYLLGKQSKVYKYHTMKMWTITNTITYGMNLKEQQNICPNCDSAVNRIVAGVQTLVESGVIGRIAALQGGAVSPIGAVGAAVVASVAYSGSDLNTDVGELVRPIAQYIMRFYDENKKK